MVHPQPTHTLPPKTNALGLVLMCCHLYCSSYGQNLKTSTYIWENLFAVFVSMSGLVLFALLIGNVQVQF